MSVSKKTLDTISDGGDCKPDMSTTGFGKVTSGILLGLREEPPPRGEAGDR